MRKKRYNWSYSYSYAVIYFQLVTSKHKHKHTLDKHYYLQYTHALHFCIIGYKGRQQYFLSKNV